ncbi:YheC/YheD family protein [Mechercharimyces sp. CAU 1602]|uniref:YheC/YheD family protein n=1 Tax=Mechercharimyces sp. CAU 1602 TaxID=2973933 RepID=UPI0021614D27|nr:YheC/YheD family protein [Mechercharimyces sp. CAU 1602]MCS1350656.1 YheC/YheD family protein [Mechercharimyces sp. CAU 1602]
MREIGYKWRIYNELKEHKQIAKSLPETCLWKTARMWSMLNKHKAIILKPSGGTGGYAVVRVTLLPANKIEICYSGKRFLSVKKNRVEKYLRKLVRWGGSRYLIQQYIPLAQIKGCPLDFRVMIQRKKISTPWVVTGYHGRKAGNTRMVVTNVARGKAKVLPVKEALTRSNIQAPPDELIEKMEKLGLLIANHTGTSPYCREIGLDFGIDRHGKVWIIESNPQPDVQPVIGGFLMLKSRKMFRKMIQYRGSRYPKKFKIVA